MATTAAIAAIGAAISRELIPAEMLDARTTMAAAAVHPYLINKIASFQAGVF